MNGNATQWSRRTKNGKRRHRPLNGEDLWVNEFIDFYGNPDTPPALKFREKVEPSQKAPGVFVNNFFPPSPIQSQWMEPQGEEDEEKLGQVQVKLDRMGSLFWKSLLTVLGTRSLIVGMDMLNDPLSLFNELLLLLLSLSRTVWSLISVAISSTICSWGGRLREEINRGGNVL